MRCVVATEVDACGDHDDEQDRGDYDGDLAPTRHAYGVGIGHGPIGAREITLAQASMNEGTNASARLTQAT